jgi:DNA repair ATPase RecN
MKGGVIMELNPDLIRDILLKAELGSFKILKNDDDDVNFFKLLKDKNTLKQFEEEKEKYQKPEEFLSYSNREIEYHTLFLKEAELIVIEKNSITVTLKISDLTVAGHNFVSNIRNDKNWNKIKEISNNIGSTSINALIEISEKLISKLIDKEISLYQ